MRGSWLVPIIVVLVAGAGFGAWKGTTSAPPAAGQDTNLEERVGQLEQRLASVEARLFTLEGASQTTPPVPTPTAAPTPDPRIDVYRAGFAQVVSQYGRLGEQVANAIRRGDMDEIRRLFPQIAATYRAMALAARGLSPAPACFASTHEALLNAVALFDEVVNDLRTEGGRVEETVGAVLFSEAQRRFAEARC